MLEDVDLTAVSQSCLKPSGGRIHMLHSVNTVAFKAFPHKITSIHNFFVIWLYVVTVHFESENPNLTEFQAFNFKWRSLTNSSKNFVAFTAVLFYCLFYCWEISKCPDFVSLFLYDIKQQLSLQSQPRLAALHKYCGGHSVQTLHYAIVNFL